MVAGCGPGNSTELLVHRFPKAQVLGTDNSEAMLASARARLPQAGFELSNIATWAPRSSEEAPDLIYANASLQWVPDHEKLIPRLFAALAPGGVLAIQMPDNRQEPTHSLMRALGAEAPWAEPIGDADSLRTLLLELGGYYDLLALLPHEGVGATLAALCDPVSGHAAVLGLLDRLLEASWRLSDEIGRLYFAHAEPTDSMVSA